ncbi:hypothetical protein K0M31_008216, partial [Melipona bicolor]
REHLDRCGPDTRIRRSRRACSLYTNNDAGDDADDDAVDEDEDNRGRITPPPSRTTKYYVL